MFAEALWKGLRKQLLGPSVKRIETSAQERCEAQSRHVGSTLPVRQAMTSLDQACSVSVFVTMASTVASSLDCEFLRTNNLIRIFAKLFQRADAAQLASRHEEPKTLKDMAECNSEECPTDSGEHGSRYDCVGIRYTTYNTKKLVLLPQKSHTGMAYYYDGDKPTEKGLHVNESRSDSGLRFAMLGGGVDDFSASAKVIFTPGLHTKLQYFGDDPAIVMQLWNLEDTSSPSSLESAESACVNGRVRQNVIDPMIYNTSFRPASGIRREISGPAPPEP